MMTARPELFAGNPDPLRLIPVDDDYVAGLRHLGAKVVRPYYTGRDPENPNRDTLPNRHIIAEMCALAGLHGEIAVRPYLALTETERAAGRIFSPRQIAVHSTGLAAAFPYTTKEWGTERLAEVARQLSSHCRLVQVGSAQDPALPVDRDLRGRTSLRETAAILGASDAFVGLEGFLGHLARAVDCPAVIVMGGRATTDIFGYSANRNFTHFPACGPCGLRTGCPNDMACMRAIAPKHVTAAVHELLANPPARPLAVSTAVLP